MIRSSQLEILIRTSSTTAIFLVLVASSSAQMPSTVEVVPTDPAVVRLAIEKGLFFVEHQSMNWWKAEKCATCHEGQMLLVAANVAKSQGVPVNQRKLDFWTEKWVFTDALVKKKDGQLRGLGVPTAPFVFLHRDRDRDTTVERSKKWASLLQVAFKWQGDDGSWTPKAAIVDITPRMALALADIETSRMALLPDLRREISERRKRTEDWIRSNELQRPEKTESLAGWVTYEYQRGEPARAKQLFDELLSRRREDGGWGMKKDDPSHLLVTSVVLLALKTSGLLSDNPVVTSTQRFILSKQSEDGRWHELGRHFHPEAYDDSYDAWTTGYAVAALSLTMPKLSSGAQRLFIPDPKLVAEIDQLTRIAAEGYEGRPDRTGDPTQPDADGASSKTQSDPRPAEATDVLQSSPHRSASTFSVANNDDENNRAGPAASPFEQAPQ